MAASITVAVTVLAGCGRSAPADEIAGADSGNPVATDQTVSTEAPAPADTGTGATVVGNDPAQETTSTVATTTTLVIVPGAGSAVHGPDEAGVRVISDGPIVAPPPSPEAGDVSAVDPAPSQTYMVESGDTLSGIAEKLGIPVDAIAEANNIADVNDIMPGQELIIPAPESPVTATEQ